MFVIFRPLLEKTCSPMQDTCLKKKRHLVSKPFLSTSKSSTSVTLALSCPTSSQPTELVCLSGRAPGTGSEVKGDSDNSCSSLSHDSMGTSSVAHDSMGTSSVAAGSQDTTSTSAGSSEDLTQISSTTKGDNTRVSGALFATSHFISLNGYN